MSTPVLHVCDKFGVRGSSIHGVSRLFSWWFPRYDSARFAVSLCGLKTPEPASHLLEEHGIPVRHLGRGRFDPRILSDLIALGRRLGARILHVHGYAAADFGRLAARRLGAGLVLHEHFADPRMPFYQGVADRLLAGLTHRAIAVSASTRDFLIEKRHVPAERVRLIWNGAPLEEFSTTPEAAGRELRRTLGFADDEVVIGSVGRLSAQKGHRYLIEAMARVAAEEAGVRLLVVGDGDEEPALRSQTEALSLTDRVCFAGYRSDIPAVLSALDVLVISSTYEGTPLALFEAMAAGKAIVSTAVDGCQEVLEDGVSALLVPPGDTHALAAAVLKTVRERPLRRALSEQARAASRRYDIRACVSHMEGLYEEVLNEVDAA